MRRISNGNVVSIVCLLWHRFWCTCARDNELLTKSDQKKMIPTQLRIVHRALRASGVCVDVAVAPGGRVVLVVSPFLPEDEWVIV